MEVFWNSVHYLYVHQTSHLFIYINMNSWVFILPTADYFDAQIISEIW